MQIKEEKGCNAVTRQAYTRLEIPQIHYTEILLIDYDGRVPSLPNLNVAKFGRADSAALSKL